MPNRKQYGEISTLLTTITNAYRNKDTIAAEIAPEVITATPNFKYNVWDKANALTVPETTVGKTGQFKGVQFTGSTKDGSVQDHGLFTNVSNQDIEDFEAINDNQFLGRNTQSLMDVILLRREVDLAKLLQKEDNYASKKIYANTTSWVNAASDPIADIEDAIDAALVRFNRMWISSDSFIALKRHPKVISRFYSGNPANPRITTDMLAEELTLEKIVIGRPQFNTAEIGKEPNIERAYKASAGLFVYKEQTHLNSFMNFITDVYCPVEGQRQATFEKILEPGDFGVKGGVRVSIGEQSTFVLQGKDLGYLFKNTTAKA